MLQKYLVEETAQPSSKKNTSSQDHMTTYVSYSLIKISKTMSLVLQLQSAWALLRRPSCSTRRHPSASFSGFQPRSSWECDRPPIQSWAWQSHLGQWSFLSRCSPSADKQCPESYIVDEVQFDDLFLITLNISALVSSLRTASGLWCEVVDTLQRPSKDFKTGNKSVIGRNWRWPFPDTVSGPSPAPRDFLRKLN